MSVNMLSIFICINAQAKIDKDMEKMDMTNSTALEKGR